MRNVEEKSTEIRVFRPSNNTDNEDFVIPADDILSADIPRTIGTLKDQAEFEITNQSGEYRTGGKKIRGGERLEFWTRLGATSQVGVTAGVLSAERDDEVIRRHTGVARNPNGERHMGGRSSLSITSEDYVGFHLANNVVEAGFENRQVSGTPESILDFILARETPEIDRSRIAAHTGTTTISFNAEGMTDAVNRLLARGNYYMFSDHTSLVTVDLHSIPNTINELRESDHGWPIEFASNDDGMANLVRVDGGEAVSYGDSQPNQSGYSTVTKENRILHRLDMPKANVPKIDLWTDPRITQSEDGVVVRLQRDRDGAPADVADESYDFARRTLADNFLQHDGYTTFLMPEHDIVNHDPWLIIEGDGEGTGEGQAIGVNTSGYPAFYAYYPYPVAHIDRNEESIQQYRRREIQVSDENLHSLEEAYDAVQALLKEHSTPWETYEFSAQSLRAHKLNPMDVVGVDDPIAGMSGNFIVTKISDTYDGSGATLETDITLSDLRATGGPAAASDLSYIPVDEDRLVASGETETPEDITVAGGLTIEGGVETQ